MNDKTEFSNHVWNLMLRRVSAFALGVLGTLSK